MRRFSIARAIRPACFFLAQESEDADEIRHFGSIDHIRGRDTRHRHAHVERPVALKRETALGFVDLHGRDADIEHHAVETFGWRKLGEIGKLRMMKGQPPTAGRDECLAAGNGIRIPVERNDTGALGENGRRIAAGTECSIKDDLAGFRLERCQHFGKKNRNVANRSAFGIRITFARCRRHSVSPSL